jgi:hypothetical protein
MKMASDQASQRPSKSPFFTRATNSRHFSLLSVTYMPSPCAELRTKTDSPKVPISTHAPLSQRVAARHIGSSTDAPPTTPPNSDQKSSTPSDTNTDFLPVSILWAEHVAYA